MYVCVHVGVCMYVWLCLQVRNFKGHKHSDYCPLDGNRYDGIYKVVRYWPEVGQAGFRVWRYLLRRDDLVRGKGRRGGGEASA